MRRGACILMGLLVTLFLMTGCSQEQTLQKELDANKIELNKLKAEIQTQTRIAEMGRESLLYCAGSAVTLLKNKDYVGLASFVHQDKGVRFSPYTFVDTKHDLVFSPEKVKGLKADTQVYEWGRFDGSGEPISLTFSEYYRRFIYDRAFIQPDKLGYNESVSSGTTIDNLKEAYPQASFIEFHFSGTQEYAQMDWASLKLVFEQINGKWFLVGIVHSQWTI